MIKNPYINKRSTREGASFVGAAGAAETLFEKFSVENLLTPKDVTGWTSWLKETLKQAGTEASEEALTEIANILSDAAIMGESSQFSQTVQEYRRDGMTDTQAKQQAFLDCVGQVAWSSAGGFISGSVTGGAVNGVQGISNTGLQAGTQTSQTQTDSKALSMLDTQVEQAGESDIINMERMFHSYYDPMHEVLGDAFESHPKEVEGIYQRLTDWKITVNPSDKVMGYQPGHPGEPGQFRVPPNASYSAWLHEEQHAIDDYNSGWKGAYFLYHDDDEVIRWERRAFQREIDLAKSIGNDDMVKRLEELLDEQIRKRKKPFDGD